MSITAGVSTIYIYTERKKNIVLPFIGTLYIFFILSLDVVFTKSYTANPCLSLGSDDARLI